jgi:hypothetical protein
MVLYGFKSEFAPLVASGQKVHTIRDLRKDDRHAKPGSKLQLYSGLSFPSSSPALYPLRVSVGKNASESRSGA